MSPASDSDEGPLPRLEDLKIKGDVLWLNGRALADERWLEMVAKSPGLTRWCVGALRGCRPTRRGRASAEGSGSAVRVRGPRINLAMSQLTVDAFFLFHRSP